MERKFGKLRHGLAAVAVLLSFGAAAQEDPELARLLNAAAERNPEVLAAHKEAEAAASRIEPAAATRCWKPAC